MSYRRVLPQIAAVMLAMVSSSACVAPITTPVVQAPLTMLSTSTVLTATIGTPAAEVIQTPTTSREKALDFVELKTSPSAAEHFDLVDDALHLNTSELALLSNSGFVVTDRLKWNRFKDAYAWIYWKDLPVLVTVDSILQTIHQSYNDFLKDLEQQLTGPLLEELLTQTLGSVLSAQAQNKELALTKPYADLVVYLQVSLALLRGEPGENPEVRHYVQLAVNAAESGVVHLFDPLDPSASETPHVVDFTLFKPRGHYTISPFYEQYFRAMTWLAQVDFRLITFERKTNRPIFNPQALVGAKLLRDHLDKTGQKDTWRRIDELLAVLVGKSDNMTLADLEKYLNDMQLNTPSSVSKVDPQSLLQQLLNKDYGYQKITSQMLGRHREDASPDPVPLPVSFMLFGQRFSLDSFVMSNLVFDRLFVDGEPVERAFPATMDLMYVLGNTHALSHLQAELDHYQYSSNLDSLRATVERMSPEFWQEPMYNQWLGFLRTLNQVPDGPNFPTTMRTQAWADKILHTQLASWAQLRHDNILYTKQSFTMESVMCEYPAGYVEPYPEFYHALHAFFLNNLTLITNLRLSSKEKDLQVFDTASSYFQAGMTVMKQLEILANKELNGETFTSDEEEFLKNIVRRQVKEVDHICALVTEEYWDGWYPSLFYTDDENPSVVADVHTNPNVREDSPLYPPGILYVASGPVVPIIMIVNKGAETAMYVGPSFTYYEFVEQGYPLVRLSDEEWQDRLDTFPRPEPPAWTRSFRYTSAEESQLLTLP